MVRKVMVKEMEKTKMEKMKMKEMKSLGIRKTTVFKKAKELSVLCDVDLLIIMYPDADPRSQPEVWCSKPEGVSEIISRYLTHNKLGKKKNTNNSQLPISNSNSKKLMGIMSESDNNNGFIHNLGIHDLNNLLARALPAKLEYVTHIINSIKNFSIKNLGVGVNSINQPCVYDFPDVFPCGDDTDMDCVDWFNLGDLGSFGGFNYSHQQGTLESLIGLQDTVFGCGLDSSDMSYVRSLLGIEEEEEVINCETAAAAAFAVAECGINSSSCSDMNAAAQSFCQSPAADECGMDSTCFDKNDNQSLWGADECRLMNFGDKDDDYPGLLGFDNNVETGMETADDLHNLLMQFEVDGFGKDEQVMGFQGFDAAAHQSIAV